MVADCRLIGRRTLPNQAEPQETTHFTARVRLAASSRIEAVAGAAPRLSAEAIVEAAQIYRIYFHGPAYQVLERAWWDGERMIGEMARALPGNHQPSDRPTLMAPRLIELCFQTAGIWEMGAHSRMGLPQHVQHVSCCARPQSAEGRLYAVVTPHPEQGTFDAEVVDADGQSVRAAERLQHGRASRRSRCRVAESAAGCSVGRSRHSLVANADSPTRHRRGDLCRTNFNE